MNEVGCVRGENRFLRELAPHVAERGARARGGIERIELGGESVYLKFGPLRGSASLRYGMRGLIGWPTPRIHEFDNLRWLRGHGFGAPRPLAAGLVRVGIRARFQYLATAEVPNARTLREALSSSASEERARLLADLGAEVARLHRCGFVHRDLFPRNVLVLEGGSSTGFAFLDAWRGGPGPQPPGRGRTYDLACLTLYLPTLCDPEESMILLEEYTRAAPLRPTGLRRLERTRRRLLLELRRRGRSSPPLPDA